MCILRHLVCHSLWITACHQKTFFGLNLVLQIADFIPNGFSYIYLIPYQLNLDIIAYNYITEGFLGVSYARLHIAFPVWVVLHKITF